MLRARLYCGSQGKMFDIISKNSSEIKFSDIFDFLTKATGALLIIFAVASVAYEYMYFWTVGFQYLAMFSASDFIKLTIYWLPGPIIATLFVFSLFYFEFRDKLRAYQNEGFAGLARWEKPDRFNSYVFFGSIALILLALPFVSWKNTAPIRYLAATFASILTIRQIAGGRLPLTRRPLDTLFFYLFVIYVWITAVFGGLDAGIRDIERKSPLQMVQTIDGDFNLVILRSIDKGVLFVDPDDKSIVFIPWGRIKNFRSQFSAASDASIVSYIKKYIDYFRSK